jgi:CheY-like chemotaxis protein
MVVQIVEDELLISMWVEDALRDVGYTVLNVETADQALVNFESRDDIDILFTDVNMPGSMDGLELAATVRERWPHVKIIVASGRQTISAEAMPPESIFLPKPYLPSDIVGAVAAVA